MQYLIFTSITTNHTGAAQLELHFDVNGTIMAADMAQGRGNESSILQEIAKETITQWESGGKEQNFRDYVDQVILPGDEVKDQSLKRSRRKHYETILSHMKETQHPQYPTVKNRFDLIMGCLNHKDSPIFKSFWKMIDWLETLEKEQGLQYKIVFRTFGHDIPAIREILLKKGFACDHLTTFKDGQLLHGDKIHDTSHHAAIMGTIAAHKFNAVQDDWKHWNAKGEKREFGKPFYVNNGDLPHEGPIRIFFDDNVTEKEIIYPMTPEGVPLNVQDLVEKGYLVNVHTLDAIVDEDYFINRVKPFLGSVF